MVVVHVATRDEGACAKSESERVWLNHAKLGNVVCSCLRICTPFADHSAEEESVLETVGSNCHRWRRGVERGRGHMIARPAPRPISYPSFQPTPFRPKPATTHLRCPIFVYPCWPARALGPSPSLQSSSLLEAAGCSLPVTTI